MRLGNINSLPWYARFSIFAAMALAVYAGFWYFVTSGTRKDTRKLVDQIKVLQKANTEAQIASQRLIEFKASYKSKQEQLEELRALLPEQRELTKVLEGIQDRVVDLPVSPSNYRNLASAGDALYYIRQGSKDGQPLLQIYTDHTLSISSVTGCLTSYWRQQRHVLMT